MAVERELLGTRIIEFIRDEIGIDALDQDTELVTTGAIDSVGIVRVAAFLERELDTTLPDQDITATHFETVRKMLSYLEARGAI